MPNALVLTIEKYENSCSESNSGTLVLKEGAITRIDLNHDNTDDWILDAAFLYCTRDYGFSNPRAFSAGTAGSPLDIFIGETHTVLMARNWEVTTMGPNDAAVLLLTQSGIVCGGDGALWCVEALVWDRDAMRSVRPNQ